MRKILFTPYANGFDMISATFIVSMISSNQWPWWVMLFIIPLSLFSVIMERRYA